MGLRKPEITSPAGLNMTPMIDMTFQLIAFFMFVLNFSKDVADERIRLPIADQAVPAEQAIDEPLFLNLNRRGSLLAIGTQWDLDREQSLVLSYLKREAAVVKRDMEYEALGDASVAAELKANRLWTTVVIRADRETRCDAVRQLLGMCRQVGFTKFALRAVPADGL